MEPKKKYAEIIAFHNLFNEKYSSHEKIAYAHKNKIVPQLEAVDKFNAEANEEYYDSLILLAKVHTTGEFEGTSVKDSEGNKVYTPENELTITKLLREAAKKIAAKEYEVEVYYLKVEDKPTTFTSEDEKVFNGFIEFKD